MSDEAGSSASALAATQRAMTTRHQAAAAADRTLIAVICNAHAITLEAKQRLDAIEAEIETAVAQQHLLALDTAAGVRDFQRFLVAKNRDIAAVITEASARSEAKAAELQQLRVVYEP